MSARDEAKAIIDTLRFNQMPDAARAWLRKRLASLLLSSIGRPIP
jgi:hypothetical protein